MWLPALIAAATVAAAAACGSKPPADCRAQEPVVQASTHTAIECNPYNKRLHNCKGDSLCQGYKCVCRQPGMVYVPQVGCKDVDECRELQPACTGPGVACHNTLGGYQCVCGEEGHSYHPFKGCGNHSTCHFPFKYKGVYRHHCISAGHHKLWCSLTADYDKDKKFMNCAAEFSTMHCHFPFRYKGKVYTKCIGEGHKKWCATTYDCDKDQKWSICY